MIRILFNGHDFRFLQPVIDYFSNHSNFKVYLDEHDGHQIKDCKKSREFLELSDIIFCEWALGNAVWYSHHKMTNQRLLVRLHHQELKTEYLSKIEWKNVDTVIFICEHNNNRFLEKFPHLSPKVRMIYNPIDCNVLNQPKIPSARFTLGFVGLSPMRKRPDIGLEIFHNLKQMDDRFKLIFKGRKPWEYKWLWERPEERNYYEEFFHKIEISEFKDEIAFEDYGDDMPSFYSKVGFILSTSDHEGSHQAVAEGMASGAIPIIRNWPGAELIYPQKYIFEDVERAVHLIQSFTEEEVFADESQRVKEYAYQNFDKSVIIPKFKEIFNQYEVERINVPSKIESNLKVLIICYLRPNMQDGYVTRVVEEARQLRRRNIEVVLAVFCHEDYFANWELISSHLEFLRKKTASFVHLIPSRDFFDVSNILNGSASIKQRILELVKLYGIQIIHGESIYPSIYGLQAAREAKVKFVFDVHGIAQEESEMNNEHPARIEAIGKAEKEILLASDSIVFVSNSMKEHYQRKYQTTLENNIIIPTCIKSDSFTMDYETRRKKRKEMGWEDKFVYLYLGTLSTWQWKEAMFNLFEQTQRVKQEVFFYLLLPKSDHGLAKELFSQKNISPIRYLISEIAHDDIGSYIGIADAGILLRKKNPVNYVSYPTKFGEYLAAGVPVITTPNIGDVSREVEEHRLGLIVNPTDEGITESDKGKLSKFMDDIFLNREFWFNHCRSFAKERLDWGLYVDNLIDSYIKILKH